MHESIEVLARPLLWLARGLLWLAWDFLVYTVAWSIGWPIWRVLTFGRFPHADWRDYDASGFWEAAMVCGAGLLALVAAIWLLSQYVA